MFSPEFYEDPYPAYREAQALSPVKYDSVRKAWVLTRYRDVEFVLKEPAVFSSEKPLNALPQGLGASMMLLSHDPPEHGILRSFVQKAFTTSNVGRLRTWVGEQVDAILEEIETDEVDVVSRLAIPLPIKVLNRVLGVPAHIWESLRTWTENATHGEHKSASYPSRKALLDLYKLFRTKLIDSRVFEHDGLLQKLASEQQGGRCLTTSEIMSFCMTLHIAGNETVANMLGNTLNILAGDDSLWRQMRADRSLIDSAIEESLRLECPVQFVSRLVVQRVAIGPVVLEPGERVLLCLGAANRDPEVYENADRFDPSRAHAPHLSFGRGIHFCLGAALTRLEASIVLNRLLDRYAAIGPVACGVRHSNAFFRGFKSLRVKLVR